MVIPASLAGGGGERWQAPPAGWRRGAGHPWPGVRIERGARSGRGSGVRVADRPVVGGWSALESAGRERGARSGRGRGSLSRGGKGAGGWWGSGRCGKGVPVEWLAVRKGSVPFGERPSVLAGAGGVAGVGAGAEDRQAVGTVSAFGDAPGGGEIRRRWVDPTGVPAGIQRTKAERSSVPVRGGWASGGLVGEWAGLPEALPAKGVGGPTCALSRQASLGSACGSSADRWAGNQHPPN